MPRITRVSHRRVLIIEDDPLIGAILLEILQRLGHKVCATAETEEEAVIASVEHEPDLLLVDADLAQGSGISAVRTIMHRRAIPHVFMSGERTDATDPAAIVLQKPFREADLVRAIAQAIDQPGTP